MSSLPTKPTVSVHDVLNRLRTWIAVISVDGTVLDLEGGDGWFFGYRNEDLIGRNTIELLDGSSAEALIQTFLQGPDAPVHARPISFPVQIVDVNGDRHRSEIIPSGFEIDGHRGWVVNIAKLGDQSLSVSALLKVIQGESLHEIAVSIADRLTYETQDGQWFTIVAVEPTTDRSSIVSVVENEVKSLLQTYLGNDEQPGRLKSSAIWNNLAPNAIGLFEIDTVPDDLAAAMKAGCFSQILVMRVDTTDGLGMVVLQLVKKNFTPHLLGNTILNFTELQTVLTRSIEREIGIRLLAERANCDSLTGLLNRSGFESDATPLPEDAAVIFVDVDKFKRVNDTFGHAVGDLVLIEIANRLRRVCRPGDLVARLGGDEFALLIRTGGKDVADAMAFRLLDTISQPLGLEFGPEQVTVSIGVADIQSSTPLSAALAAADIAMFEAKRYGRARMVTRTVLT